MPLLRTYPSLKVWVAGCSTGEEVYSLAILLREEGLLDAHADLRDRHQPAGAAEGRGRRLRRRPHRRLHREPSPVGRHVVAVGLLHRGLRRARCSTRSLRKHIVFSDHSLATDSVFAEVQLVSCRNVLIYFNRELQDRAVGLFREALVPQGLPRHRRQGVAALLGARRRVRRARRASERIYPEAGRARDRARASPRPRRRGRHRRLGRRRRGAVDAAAGAAGRTAARRCSSCCTCRASAPSLLAEIFAREVRAAGARGRGQGAGRAGHGLLRAARLPPAGRARAAARAVGRRARALLAAVDRRAVRVGGRRVRRAAARASS